MSTFLNDTWLQDLPPHIHNDLQKSIKTKTYPAHQMVQIKNSPADGLYGVISGEVRISATTSSGEEIVFTRITKGQWFGEIALLDGGVKTHDGYTTEESELAIIPKYDILSLCEKYPEIHRALVMLLCQHCRQAFKAIDDFLLFTPEQRMAKLLLTRFDYRNHININQKELGALTGISRQSTNKILKLWENKGWIKRGYKQLSIDQPQELKILAQL